ncbi:hypothetical protein G4B88_024111 [Cannabis sativa]|uniref:CUE domain-containing protein n=1 Tax=Cannabis sativa TaxID=3483 RepID=A0A7J6EGV3_CANSA|nr:hypothetical protein G4B88_024111 [Cannabis sativa]
MSAIVCGKRSIFEELPTTPSVSKRIRFSSSSTSPSSSPARFSPPKSFSVSVSASSNQYPFGTSSQSLHFIDCLKGLFPDMDPQLLERAVEECGDDLDSAIRSLNELRLGSASQNLGSAAGTSDVAAAAEGNVQQQSQVTINGESDVTASDMDDAKARASRVLEVLEKSIYTRASADVAQTIPGKCCVEGTTIKATGVPVSRAIENTGGKNYALTMHLKQAQQGNSIPGRFHPDVF